MNLPNKITFTRLLLIPGFVLLLPFNRFLACIVFVLASLTDFLDGYIARSKGLVTNLGKLMDPLVDKILVNAAFISFVELGDIPGWTVILIIFREFLITGLRSIAAEQGVVIAASYLGKAKTVSQIIACILIMLKDFVNPIVHFPIDLVAFYICMVLTLVSGADYLIKSFKVLKME